MKKLLRLSAAALLWLLPPAGLPAQEWGSLYAPGAVSISTAAGVLAFDQGLSLAGYAGAEVILYELVISDLVPLEVGAAGRGLLDLFGRNESLGDYGWLAFGGGGFGTLHFSFRGSDLNIPAFLEKVDFNAALGLVFTYFSYTGNWGTLGKYAETGLGLAAWGGVGYFLSERLALTLEGGYWGFGAGASIGVLMKL